MQAFQNGEYGGPHGYDKAGRLHGQNRSKGRLFLSSNLEKDHRKYRKRFQWKGKLYHFIALAFGLGPAPRVFTKVLKPIVSCFFGRIGMRLMIFLGRSDIDKFRPERVNEGSPYSSVGFGELGIPDKFGEIGYNADPNALSTWGF